MGNVPRTFDGESVRAIHKKIKSVDEHREFPVVLVYGDNGSGKTRLACSGPNALIVSMREIDGTRSGKGSGAKVVTVDSFDELADVYWYLARAKHGMQTLGLDGLVGMYALAMEKVLEESGRSDGKPRKQDYGDANALFNGLVLNLCKLPMAVVMTALPRVITDEETGEVTSITADLPAGARGVAMGAAGIVGYLRTEKVRVRSDGRTVRRYVTTMLVEPNDEGIIVKDRTNNLGGKLIAPTVPKIISAWNSRGKDN